MITMITISLGLVGFLRQLETDFDLHLVYLIARPFTHFKETKQFLEGIRDSKTSEYIPKGPLFTNRYQLMDLVYLLIVLQMLQWILLKQFYTKIKYFEVVAFIRLLFFFFLNLINRENLMRALYREVISKDTVSLKSSILLSIVDVFRIAGLQSRSPFILGTTTRLPLFSSLL